jgi:hypothetical protein
MSEFEVRLFQIKDQKAVEDLVLTIQQGEYGYQLTTENQPDLKDISSFFTGGHSAFWVAESAMGEIIGCTTLPCLPRQAKRRSGIPLEYAQSRCEVPHLRYAACGMTSVGLVKSKYEISWGH